MPGKRGSSGVRFFALLVGLSCVGAALRVQPVEAGPAPGPQSTVQTRTANPVPPPTGTAAVTVQVVASDSGAPVRGARLMLFGSVTAAPAPRTQGAPAARVELSAIVDGVPVRDAGVAPPRVQKEGRTDQAGTATFAALPAGVYTVSVTPPGAFVRGQSPSSVQVKDGANAKVLVQLDRGGVITGRVFDENGEPVTGARVSVIRQEKFAGSSSASTFGSSDGTNDLGQFRIWALPAGDYLVSASFSDYSMMPGGDSGVRDGPLPTFYPGVAAFDAARPVVVKVGQETGGVEFPLVHGRLGTVSGRATDSAGSPLSGPTGIGANVSLAPRGFNPTFGSRGGGIRPDGSFTIQGVPPGDYYLTASRNRPDLPDGGREGAFVPVSVNGDEVTVNIQTNLGATISGRVDIEGTAPPAQPGAPGAQSRAMPARISLVPASLGGYGMAFALPSQAVVRSDGTFSMSGARGLVQITAQGGRAALVSVTRGGRDISGQPLELLGTERIDDIAIVLTEATGSIEGMVTDAGGEPVPGAPVVIFPDNSSRWSVGSPFVRQSRSMSASAASASQALPTVIAAGVGARAPLAPGAFSAAMLPAGRYAVVALPPGTTVMRPEREALERWRQSATIVTVEVGRAVVVKLAPIK